MKKVILGTENTISIKNINNNSVIGIQWGNGSKGLISYGEKGFFSSSIDKEFSQGDWHYSNSIRNYIRQCLKIDGEAGIYSFKTYREFFNWIDKK